ncbi:unnamed protein product [Musa acuminata subsp. malaccensis]|uniref:(wild Malaysian banana) hypothetical protein n=1 Tax=Musa acuminata subsp. malaccensis TaxID=214687 RepID=A0A804KNJ8_MUSAM|nr:PREDICTED: uncharacterized protein LOC103998896 [Musa acuminata subsp. malaccensis]CAG1836437.1 unnamed protein product [Musa acuminata subsp. malaccensis]
MAAAPSPVEVGAQGTIASLILQEIEYLRRLDLDGREVSNQKEHKVNTDVASTSGSCKQKPCPSRAAHKKKKKAAAAAAAATSGGFLPSICSATDATDTSLIERIARIGYRNLRTDGKKLSED